MKRAAAWAPFALLVFLVIAAAVVLTRGGERQTVSSGMVGRAAPAYALERLSGGEDVSSAAFEGRPHLINVFASWCAPCRVEHPLLMELSARGVPIVGVAYKDDADDTARFLRELGDPFAAVGMDRDGRYGLELGVAGAPETFVIGADGRVRAIHRGPLTEEIIAREIMPALTAP